MPKTQPLTIAHVEGLSLKTAAGVFVTAFGLVWLFIEPLGLFGLLPQLSGWMGFAAYIVMLIAAIAAVRIAVLVRRRYGHLKLTFVTFTVASSTDGADHLVRAPVNMQVWDFVYLFLRKLEDGPAAERVRALNRQFDPILQLGKDGHFIDIGNSLTLTHAGIIDGALCRIRGEPRKERGVLFSRGAARG